MKIAIAMAIAALLCGCPEHTATNLDIVPRQHEPIARNDVPDHGHGRSMQCHVAQHRRPHRRAPRA